ncbi:MAG: hypothetical protein AABX70_02935 [Nanoarchaeota archaeon]
MSTDLTGKIGIINFNPDQNPDTIEYIDKIGALIPQGIEYRGFHFTEQVDFSGCSALILSGSKLSATNYQKMVQKGAIEGADYLSIDGIAKKLAAYQGSMFGICFGAQLVAHVMGGRLGKLVRVEPGYLQHELTDAGKKDLIFGKLPERFYGAHLHQDYVDTLPNGELVKSADVLAMRNGFIHAFKAVCANGAVRYGVQPHPEMSTPENAVFLVRHTKSWLEGEIGREEYENALIIPTDAGYELAETITQFAQSIKGFSG